MRDVCEGRGCGGGKMGIGGQVVVGEHKLTELTAQGHNGRQERGRGKREGGREREREGERMGLMVRGGGEWVKSQVSWRTPTDLVLRPG